MYLLCRLTGRMGHKSACRKPKLSQLAVHFSVVAGGVPADRSKATISKNIRFIGTAHVLSKKRHRGYTRCTWSHKYFCSRGRRSKHVAVCWENGKEIERD